MRHAVHARHPLTTSTSKSGDNDSGPTDRRTTTRHHHHDTLTSWPWISQVSVTLGGHSHQTRCLPWTLTRSPQICCPLSPWKIDSKDNVERTAPVTKPACCQRGLDNEIINNSNSYHIIIRQRAANFHFKFGVWQLNFYLCRNRWGNFWARCDFVLAV
jgi:hypothetical protein